MSRNRFSLGGGRIMRPNQALALTPIRRVLTFKMIKAVPVEAELAVGATSAPSH